MPKSNATVLVLAAMYSKGFETLQGTLRLQKLLIILTPRRPPLHPLWSLRFNIKGPHLLRASIEWKLVYGVINDAALLSVGSSLVEGIN